MSAARLTATLINPMPTPNLLALHQHLIQMADVLAIDPTAYPPELKARDKAEPFLDEKQAAERALFVALQSFFAAQARRIFDAIQARALTIERKANPFDDLLNDDFWAKEDLLLRARLVDFYARNARRSVQLNNAWTAKRFNIIFDDTLTNPEAAAWARQYGARQVTHINATTRRVIRNETATWIETPGATLRDLMDVLPFSEQRAARIATTETTSAFANGERILTERLQETYPSLKIVRIWHTNNDSLVCSLCGPLNGKQIDAGKQFYSKGEWFDGPPRHVGCRCWSGRDILT